MTCYILQDSVAVMESVVKNTYYINLEDEPNVLCVNRTNHTVKFDRFVRAQLLCDACRTVVIGYAID